MTVGPASQPTIFWQAVPADSWTREDNVAVRGPHLDRFYYFGQIDAIALGENRPFVQEGEDRGAIGVFNDFRSFGFDWPIHHRKRELLDIDHLVQEVNYSNEVINVEQFPLTDGSAN